MLGRRAFLTGLLLSLGAGSALAQNGAPAAPRPVAPPRRPSPEQRRQREERVEVHQLLQQAEAPRHVANVLQVWAWTRGGIERV